MILMIATLLAFNVTRMDKRGHNLFQIRMLKIIVLTRKQLTYVACIKTADLLHRGHPLEIFKQLRVS